jgi:hypothetical protein
MHEEIRSRLNGVGVGEEKEELFVLFGPDHLSPHLPSQNMHYLFRPIFDLYVKLGL